jgi:hypothetical protein
VLQNPIWANDAAKAPLARSASERVLSLKNVAFAYRDRETTEVLQPQRWHCTRPSRLEWTAGCRCGEMTPTPSGFRGNKAALPSKPCQRCGLAMSWRRQWAKNWAEVKYCSEACRRNKAASRG